MNPALLCLASLLLGLFTGLRSFTPVALVAWCSVWGWLPLAGSPLSFLGTQTGAVISSVLAAGELIADKLPFTPARTQAGPLVARIVMGAMCGAALWFANGGAWFGGVLCGAIGAIAGTFAGYHVRRFLVTKARIPDLIVALMEDIFTIGGTLAVISYLLRGV